MTPRSIPAWAVPATWRTVEHLLEPALAKAQGEFSLEQLKKMCIDQCAELVVSQGNEGVELACVVEYITFPNYRVANVIALGGKGLRQEHVDILGAWVKCCRDCKFLQALCGEVEARLYRRFGFQKAYNVVRVPL